MKQHFDKTETWQLSLGTTPGYALDGQRPLPEADFARLYQDEAEAVFAETGVFVTAVMQPVRMLYRNEWGCPPEGEFGYALHGVRNPRFTGREAFLQALEMLAERLKARLGQAAMHLEAAETELDYLTLDEKGADV